LANRGRPALTFGEPTSGRAERRELATLGGDALGVLLGAAVAGRPDLVLYCPDAPSRGSIAVCTTARSLRRSWPVTPTGLPKPTTGTPHRCTRTAAPCCASRLTRPTPCRTPSSSRRPSWRDCVIGTGSGHGCTPWPATSATGGCGTRRARLLRRWTRCRR